MNKTQLQTTSASLVGVMAGFLAGRGVFGFDVATWTTLLGALVAFGSIVWPIIATRAKALKDSTASLPGTTVVTDQASANASSNPDVVGATPEIVNAIKKAQ